MIEQTVHSGDAFEILVEDHTVATNRKVLVVRSFNKAQRWFDLTFISSEGVSQRQPRILFMTFDDAEFWINLNFKKFKYNREDYQISKTHKKYVAISIPIEFGNAGYVGLPYYSSIASRTDFEINYEHIINSIPGFKSSVLNMAGITNDELFGLEEQNRSQFNKWGDEHPEAYKKLMSTFKLDKEADDGSFVYEINKNGDVFFSLFTHEFILDAIKLNGYKESKSLIQKLIKRYSNEE